MSESGEFVVSVARSDTHDARSGARVLGRSIVHARMGRLSTLVELEAFDAEVFAAIDRAGYGAVIFSDARAAQPFPRDVADRFARSMRTVNDKILRSAILLDPAHVAFNLRFERLVRCAQNPSRRVFTDPVELQAWLSEVLTEPDRAVLAALFAASPRFA